MNKLKFMEYISKYTTKNNSLMDHIWTNIFGQDIIHGSIEAYWLNYYKPIYCAFKLLEYFAKIYKKWILFKKCL